MTRRYLRPRNLTWWAGVASLVLGVALILWPSSELTEIGRVIALLVGAADASPAVLIVTGLGLIGLNDKFERERERRPSDGGGS
jgi:drug/metabolite transporter (DMT)-like permease